MEELNDELNIQPLNSLYAGIYVWCNGPYTQNAFLSLKMPHGGQPNSKMQVFFKSWASLNFFRVPIYAQNTEKDARAQCEYVYVAACVHVKCRAVE